MEKIGEFTVALISLVVSLVVTGYTLAKLWSWFIVSQFHVEELNLINSMGLCLVLGYVVGRNKSEDGETGVERTVKKLLEKIITSGIILLLGWILTYWM